MALFSKDEDINSLTFWISVFIFGTGQTFYPPKVKRSHNDVFG